MAYVSDDEGATWQHEPVDPPDVGYAPTVVKYRGRYLLTACKAPLYASDDPLGPFEELGPMRTPDGRPLDEAAGSDGFPTGGWDDPMLFADRDGRLFAYWGLGVGGIKGAELDGDDPTRLLTMPKVLFEFDSSHVWERFGECNEDASKSFVEGPWMLRVGDRYFLTYTAPGTEFATYAMGTYVADSPLGPFTYQSHNPICQSPHGLVRGAGHGCVIEGHGGKLWAFFTCGSQVTHNFERRLGMAPAFVDANDELRVEPGTDVPMRLAGDRGRAGLVPVNRAKIPQVSSHSPGRTGNYACDGDLRTWWQPAAEDQAATITVNFNGRFDIAAARVCFSEPGLDYANHRPAAATQWTLEARDGDGPWTRLADNAAGEDRIIDYRKFEPLTATQGRLTLDAVPYAIGVANLAYFGTSCV